MSFAACSSWRTSSTWLSDGARRHEAAVTGPDAGFRLPWSENLRVIQTSHFTRYPLITTDPSGPKGSCTSRDLVIHSDCTAPDLQSITRPLLATTRVTSLETLFAEMQRGASLALVADARGQWTGFLTLEDVMEELVGTIRDEFEDEEPVRLADALTLGRVQFDVEGESPIAAIRAALDGCRRQPAAARRADPPGIGRRGRSRDVPGAGIAMPHARVPDLGKPFLMILRSTTA